MAQWIEKLELRSLMSALSGQSTRSVANIDWRGGTASAVAGEYIVTIDPRVTFRRTGDLSKKYIPQAKWDRIDSAISSALERTSLGITFQGYLGLDNMFLVSISDQADYRKFVTKLNAVPGFLDIEPDWVGELASVSPTDPGYVSDQKDNWQAAISTEAAWGYTQGSSSIAVAQLDSGVNYNHEDLAPNLFTNVGDPVDGVDNDGNGAVDDVHGWSFVNGPIDPVTGLPEGDNAPLDDNGHGTAVAGVLAARGQNGVGVAGVNWYSKLLPVQITDYANGAPGTPDESGHLQYSRLLWGLNYVNALVDRGANIRVINASFGLRRSYADASEVTALEGAINDLGDNGVIVVCAALNYRGRYSDTITDIDNGYYMPAGLPCSNLVTVAATSSDSGNQALTNWSDVGPNSVLLAAPGGSNTDVNGSSPHAGDIYTTTWEKGTEDSSETGDSPDRYNSSLVDKNYGRGTYYAGDLSALLGVRGTSLERVMNFLVRT